VLDSIHRALSHRRATLPLAVTRRT
jgi:hypothetical protein